MFAGSLVLEFRVSRALGDSGRWSRSSGFLSRGGRSIGVTQTRRIRQRNHPILSHFRFFFEYIRPGGSGNTSSRERQLSPRRFRAATRPLGYQRAKQESGIKRPFGAPARRLRGLATGDVINQFRCQPAARRRRRTSG